MNPKMLASFEDGSKTMIEMTALANAINLPPDKIGMNGPVSEVNDLNKVLIPKEDGGVLAGTGRVDYAFGPAPGVFSIVKSVKFIRLSLPYRQLQFQAFYRNYN